MDQAPEVCETCQRPLTSRECSNEQHRAAHGKDPLALRGLRECADLHHKGERILPLAKFWSGSAHTFRKTCSVCRFRRRVQRRSKHRSGAIRIKHEVDQFWNEQAATHR